MDRVPICGVTFADEVTKAREIPARRTASSLSRPSTRSFGLVSMAHRFCDASLTAQFLVRTCSVTAGTAGRHRVLYELGRFDWLARRDSRLVARQRPHGKVGEHASTGCEVRSIGHELISVGGDVIERRHVIIGIAEDQESLARHS
jgi:hypothetical protein